MGVKTLLLFLLAFATQLSQTNAFMNEECIFEGRTFVTQFINGETQLPVMKSAKKTETEEECKAMCDSIQSCIMWQRKPTTGKHKCHIIYVEPIISANKIFGIKNCKSGKPRGELTPICKVRKGDRVNRIYRIEPQATMADCKAKCDDHAECLIWEFEKTSKSCTIVKNDINENINTHNGIKYCSPARCGVPNKPTNFFPPIGGRIIGGGFTEPNQYPWQVVLSGTKISDGYTYDCGGTLISDKSVLTAAHCVVGMKDLTVKVGVHDKKNDQVPIIAIKKDEVFVHPEYDNLSYENDIAVLTLSERVEFDQKKTAPICLPSDEEYLKGKQHEGIKVRVIGWGRTDKNMGIQSSSDILKHTDINTINSEECRNTYREYYKNKDKIGQKTPFCDQICALGEGTAHSKGDSGGPLMWKQGDQYYQIGIVSNSIKEKQQNGETIQLLDKPTIYIKTTSHLKFIMKYMVGNTWPEE